MIDTNFVTQFLTPLEAAILEKIRPTWARFLPEQVVQEFACNEAEFYDALGELFDLQLIKVEEFGAARLLIRRIWLDELADFDGDIFAETVPES